MTVLHPQFIKDSAGKNLVVLPQEEFDQLLEDLEDVRLFDDASKIDTGERILFSDYLKNRKK
jgi:hypothetical protein